MHQLIPRFAPCLDCPSYGHGMHQDASHCLLQLEVLCQEHDDLRCLIRALGMLPRGRGSIS